MALESIILEDKYEAGKDLSIWKWTIANYCETLEITQQWVVSCLEKSRLNLLQPFVIVDKTQHKIVGSTSYLNISLEHKAIEIGFTFLNPKAQ